MSTKKKTSKTKKAKSTKRKAVPKAEVKSVIAKEKDGGIQITYTIPYKIIENAQSKALKELATTTNVPGFRKGKAPNDVVKRHVDQNSLLEKSLSIILPKMVGDTIDRENLRLAIYPKFQILKAKENEPWEVRAQTAEIPEFKLGDYKKIIRGQMRSQNIWTPGKDKKDPEKKEKSREEKEQEIIKALLETVKITIPKMLIEEEANSRLSRLLERIEKLGLNLDSYLSSIGKKPADIRAEYKKQAKDTIALDLILNRVAEEENVDVNKADIQAAISAANGGKSPDGESTTDEQKRLIESILRKRSALNLLVSSF